MSRSILFPIPFVPQKLRFGGQNFIWGQKFYLRAEMKNFWPQIKFCPLNQNFIPPNHVPKFCLANFNNNMGHKTTFGQINRLNIVGNWISDLFGQTRGLLRQIQTFRPSLCSFEFALVHHLFVPEGGKKLPPYILPPSYLNVNRYYRCRLEFYTSVFVC